MLTNICNIHYHSCQTRLLFATFIIILWSIGYCSNHTWLYSANTSIRLPYELSGHIAVSHKNGLHILGGQTIATFNTTDIKYDSNVIKYCSIHSTCNAPSDWTIPFNIKQNYEFVCLTPSCFTVIHDIVFIIAPYNRKSSRSLKTNILIYNLSSISFIPLHQYSISSFPLSFGIWGKCITSSPSTNTLYAFGAYCHYKGWYCDDDRVFILHNHQWNKIKTTKLHIARYNAGCNIDQKEEYIYIFGGNMNDESIGNYPYIMTQQHLLLFTKTIERYSIKDGTFDLLQATLADDRSSPSVVVTHTDHFILFGGVGLYASYIQIFDANTHRMLNHTLFEHVYLAYHALASGWLDATHGIVHHAFIYIVNPYTNGKNDAMMLMVYDMIRKQFVPYAQYQYMDGDKEKLYGSCVVANDEYVFMIAGYHYICPFEVHECKKVSTKAITYDIEEDAWVYMNEINIARYECGCNMDAKNENVYIFGGRMQHDTLDGTPLLTISIEQYNISANTWNLLHGTYLTPARYGHFVMNTKLNWFIIYGGYNAYDQIVSSIQWFDTDEHTIRTLVHDSITRSQFGSVWMNDYDLYLFGGIDYHDTSDILNDIQHVNMRNYTDTSHASNRVDPTSIPTFEPTINPTLEPTFIPTLEPTIHPIAIDYGFDMNDVSCYMYYISDNNTRMNEVKSATIDDRVLLFSVYGKDWSVLLGSALSTSFSMYLYHDERINAVCFYIHHRECNTQWYFTSHHWYKLWIVWANHTLRIGVLNNTITAHALENVLFEYAIPHDGFAIIDEVQIVSNAYTEWLIYDYNDSDSCDMNVLDEYSKHSLIYRNAYAIEQHDTIQIAIVNNYLMFDIQMETNVQMTYYDAHQNEIISIEFGTIDACINANATDLYYVIISKDVCASYAPSIDHNTMIFWVYWDPIHVLIGNGHVIGQSIWISYNLTPSNTTFDTLYLHSDDDNTVNIWSSECMLDIWMYCGVRDADACRFIEGERIYINYTTCYTHTPQVYTIFIDSVALNIRYYMTIHQATSQCLLCVDNRHNRAVMCDGCDAGIKMDHTARLDVSNTNNTYPIRLYSEDVMLRTDVIYLKRQIMKMQFNVQSNTFYPGSVIHFEYVYNTSEITQTYALIDIDSMALQLNLTIIINLQINECMICDRERLDHWNTLECEECSHGIKVPSNVLITDQNIIQIHSTNIHLITDQNLYHPLSPQIVTVHIDIKPIIILGDAIPIEYVVHKSNNDSVCQPMSHIRIQCVSIPSIHHRMIIHHETNQCTICDTSDQTRCNVCHYGLHFVVPYETYKDTIGTHIINITSNNTQLSQHIFTIRITRCPIGQGIGYKNNTNESVTCHECDTNTISVTPSLEPCIQCSKNEHYQCHSPSSISIDYNSWITVSNHSIISAPCPANQCCKHIKGCNYIPHKPNSLCALNRDVHVPLCGECQAGYSETFGTFNTNQCAICNGHNYKYLLIQIAICLCIVLLLLYLHCAQPSDGNSTDSLDTDVSYEYPNQSESMQTTTTTHAYDDIYALFISIFRITTYFYQFLFFLFHSKISSFLFLESNVLYAQPLLQIFSLQCTLSSVCLISNLDSFTKQLWNMIFMPFVILFSLFFFFIIFECFYLFGKCCINCHIRFKHALCSYALIVFGPLCYYLVRFTLCIDLGGTSFHFYISSKHCYQNIWQTSLIMIAFIITFWILVFVIVLVDKYCTTRMRKDGKELRNEWIEIIHKPYQNTHWFWEYWLLIRRFAFIMIINITYVLPMFMSNILLVVLLIACCIMHYRCKPFAFKALNIMDTLCLSLSILILVIITFSNVYILSLDEDHIVPYLAVINIILCVLIGTPMIALFCQCMMMMIHWLKPTASTHQRKSTHSDGQNMELSLPTINESVLSMTKDAYDDSNCSPNVSMDAYLFYDEPLPDDDTLSLLSPDISPLEYFKPNPSQDVEIKTSECDVSQHQVKKSEMELISALDQHGVELSVSSHIKDEKQYILDTTQHLNILNNLYCVDDEVKHVKQRHNSTASSISSPSELSRVSSNDMVDVD
eukprot:530705_1